MRNTMKSGISINELAAELNRQNNAKLDLVSPATDIQMFIDQPNPRLHVNGYGQFDINPNAHSQLGQRLGIQATYYKKMLEDAPDLLAYNVNHWLQKQPSDERHLVRTLDGKARAIMSDRYRIIDNWDVFQSILPILMELGSSLKYESCQVTDSKLYIKAVFPWIQGDVTQGDTVQAGLMISNSEIGGGALTVYPLLYRLVCLNGMVRPIDGMRKYHVGRELGEGDQRLLFRDDTLAAEDRAMMLKVRDVVKASMSEAVFNQGLLEMRKATEVKVEEPIKTVEVLTKRMGYTSEVGISITEYLLKGGDITQYGLANAVTRVSQDVADYDMATQLEMDGHKILTMTPDRHGVFQVAN